MKHSRRRVTFPPRHFLDPAAKEKATRRGKPISRGQRTEIMDGEAAPMTESFLLQPPSLIDDLVTPTSRLQNATLAECLPLLHGINSPSQNPFDYDERGIRQLDVEAHIAFAEDALASFPAPFVSIDASRPWMVYWALTALHFLGEDVASYRERVVKTFFPLQNTTGGFGGGQGHYSHLAGTYATVLSLALVGGVDAYALTDRHAMWTWLGRLKQADGGFQICENGEEDTRAAYCALLIIALLDLPWTLPPDSPARALGLETFGDGLGHYISRCQTYEGGISSEPGTEAHGAYAFCALAALCLLDAPHCAIPKYLDVDQLLLWLSSRQYAPEGGFAGRTNKVVDGCYSHWLGDCFPLIQAALAGPAESLMNQTANDLYSVEGLRRYILNCCQNPDGGLRDKPSKGPDSYHTCYTLAGLSTGEHYHYYTSTHTSSSRPTEPLGGRFDHVFAWKVMRHPQDGQQANDSPGTIDVHHAASRFHGSTDLDFHSNRTLNAVHPVFVAPHDAVLKMREWSVQQERLV